MFNKKMIKEDQEIKSITNKAEYYDFRNYHYQKNYSDRLYKETSILFWSENDSSISSILDFQMSNIYKASGKEQFEKEAFSGNYDLILIHHKNDTNYVLKLCDKIKQDKTTGCIPVIILTSSQINSSASYKLYTSGANSVMQLTEDQRIIYAVIKNTLTFKSNIEEACLLRNNRFINSIQPHVSDENFSIKVTNVLNKHITDSEFSVDHFSKQMNMSRSTLFRKVKQHFNLSPSQLITKTRIIKSAEIIRNTQLPISYIAFSLGFSSPSYFSKLFRTYFNLSPTEYQDLQPEKKTNNEDSGYPQIGLMNKAI